MQRFVDPNPLDSVFFATDAAAQRLGLPGCDIHLHMDLAGRVDVPGLRRAWEGLRRLYPIAAASLVHGGVDWRPRWRLGEPFPDPEELIAIRYLPEDDESHVRAASDELLNTRADLAAPGPLRITLLRGPREDHALIFRWPHALMDARGGLLAIEALARLYDQRPDLDRLDSLGDEARDDFSARIARVPWWKWPLALRRAGRPAGLPRGRSRHLPQSDPTGRLERMRYRLIRLTSEQFARIRDYAMALCGFARFSDYFRIAAVRALHEQLPPCDDPAAGYSTVGLIDERQRRQTGPAFRNLFSTMPYFLPSAFATDPVALSRLFEEQTRTLLEHDHPTWRLIGLRLMALAPPWLVGRLVARGLRRAVRGLPIGLANAPSLPLGFVAYPQGMTRFCGASVRTMHGIRTIAPQAGIALHVNTCADSLNAGIVFYEPRITEPQALALLEAFVQKLLNPHAPQTQKNQ